MICVYLLLYLETFFEKCELKEKGSKIGFTKGVVCTVCIEDILYLFLNNRQQLLIQFTVGLKLHQTK